MRKVAVLLTGCGYKDGSAITEAVSSLIALSSHECEYQIFAPNLDIESTNHLNDSSDGPRNTLTESSRIARGQITDLKELNPTDFEALLIPGGFGAALHLCDWAKKGSKCDVDPLVKKLITEFHESSRPIGAICIAPALIARVLGHTGLSVTIGDDPDTAAEIEKTGAEHIDCPVDDYITDRANKVITTPAYMYADATPAQVFKGISGLVAELFEMA